MKIALPRKIPYPRALAAVAAGVVLYLLLGFLLAPWLIGRAIPDFAAEKLQQRKATAGTVRFNPILFRLEIEKFALAERDGTPIAAFGRLVVNFELSSILRGAWTFSEVALDGLDLKADIAPDGRFNIAALLGDLAGPEARPGAKPPRLLLQRVALRDGAISFSDRSDATHASARASPINFELHDISTLADHRGQYSFRARLAEGGDLDWNGEISLQPLSSRGDIALKGVKPATAWRFLQDELGLAAPRGDLDFSARYQVAYAPGVPQATLEDLRVAVRDLSLALKDAKEPMLALSSIEVAGGKLDLATRRVSIPRVVLRDGRVGVDVDPDGRINWQKLVRVEGKDGARKNAAAPGRPWIVDLESLRTEKVGLDYTDRSRTKPIHISAQDVAAGLALKLETRPDGPQLMLEKVEIGLTRLAVGGPAPAEPLAVLDTVTLGGGALDLAESRLHIGKVAIAGGSVRLSREKGGALPLVELLSPSDAGLLRREVEGALKRARKEGHPWRVALDALEVSGTRIALSDQSFGAPVAYDVQGLRARVDGFRSDGKDPVRFDVALQLAQGGSVAANGTMRLSGDYAAGRVKLDRINLKPLQPLLASRARVVLASGELSTDIKAQYRLRGNRHVVRASGPISIGNLRVNEAESGERLVSWKSLAMDSVRLSLDPDELRTGEVKVTGLGAKIVIFKDRSVNLAQVFTLQEGQKQGAKVAPVTTGDTEELFPINFARVDVVGGEVEFTDLSLVLPFSANVKDLGGVVQGVSTNRNSRASVRLEGRVDEYGLARVEGSLRPFQPKSFLDLAVAFRNVDMPPLSPYTATFAGRRIASGRLALDLRYKIENSMLAGENRVVLEKFTLGERVDAPGAMSLPLDLAVALLTDSQGRIDIAVPVSGNVDDPQFSYGHLIWQAVSSFLTRVVTAPFRALGALFGGGSGGENLESVAFDPGRATLLPPEREKLKRVAEGAAKRPQLRLVAEGQHGAADQAALRQRDVESAVSARLRRPTAADAMSEPVNVTEARAQRALEAIFIERNSEQALDEFAAAAGKSRGKPVDRVSAVLALAGRASADTAFYEALLKRLVETARVPEDALRQLADARARAVTTYLVDGLSFPASRVEARTAAAPDEARVKLGFEAARAGGEASAPPGPESPASPR